MTLPTLARASQHGVMIHYRGKGILITGEAGIGKSSLALELIHHGGRLIADDVVDLIVVNDKLTAHCPKKLTGLLHTRELGLMDIRAVCGAGSWQATATVDFCLELKHQHYPSSDGLTTPFHHKCVLGTNLDVFSLSVNNPASLKTRFDSFLALLSVQLNSKEKLHLWQQQQLAF